MMQEAKISVKIISHEELVVSIADARKLMYWTAKMASGLIYGRKSDEDICDQIEKKVNELLNQKGNN